MKIVLLVSALFLLACGKSGGSSPSYAAPAVNENIPEKDLFSMWNAVDSSLDFQGFEFNLTDSTTLVLSNGIGCNVNVLFTGNQQNALFSISAAQPAAHCSFLNGSYTLVKSSDNVLTVCDFSNNCSDYN